VAECQGRYHANAWHRHEATRRFVCLCKTAHIVIELALLPAYLVVNHQERLDDRPQLVIFAQQLDDLLSELHADRPSEQQPIFLDHAVDLVFDIATDAYETGASDKDGADLLALLALDPHLSIPANPDKFGKAARVILVALIHTNGECRVRMSSVDADDGKIDAPQFMPEPARHRSGFEANAFGMRRTFSKQLSQHAGIGLCFTLKDHPPNQAPRSLI
jgi:hypothetical protein